MASPNFINNILPLLRLNQSAQIFALLIVLIIMSGIHGKPVGHQATSLSDIKPDFQLTSLTTDNKNQLESSTINHYRQTQSTILQRLATRLAHQITRRDLLESTSRFKRWDANMLAMSLYERSPEHLIGGSHRAVNHIYDSLGGGVWGRKRRNVPEFPDFE